MRALIAVSGVPLAAPGANSSGRSIPTKAERVYDDLKGKADIIFDGGPCLVGLESTVVNTTSWRHQCRRISRRRWLEGWMGVAFLSQKSSSIERTTRIKM